MRPIRTQLTRSAARRLRISLARLRRRIRNSWRDENYLAWTMYVPDPPPSHEPAPKP